MNYYYKSGSSWTISRHEKLRANKVSTKRIPVPALTKDHQQPPQFKEKGKNLIEHHLNRCWRLTRILTLLDSQDVLGMPAKNEEDWLIKQERLIKTNFELVIALLKIFLMIALDQVC